MEELFCTNHPEIVAKRKCYKCKKALCNKCIIKSHHHIFCSDECIKEYKKELLLKNIKNKARMPVPLTLLIIVILLSFSSFFFLFYKFREEIFSYYIFTIKERIFTNSNYIYETSPKIENEFYKFKLKIPKNGILLFNGKNNDFFWLPVFEKEVSFSSYKIPPPNYVANLPRDFIKLKSSFNKSNAPLPFLSLTFDAGSNIAFSEEIINFLLKEKIQATFFLTGNFMKKYPEIVKKIYSSNFEIGNHTNTHPHLTTFYKDFKQKTLPDISFDRLKKELNETDIIFKSITGKNLIYFWRAPYGEYNEEIISWGWQAGYFHIGWSWDSLDWIDEDFPNFNKRVQKINELKEIISKNEKELYGKILLFHLGNNNPEELKEIINLIKSKNIEIVPVSTLLATDAFYKVL